jgi:acyl carrier protein
MLDQFTPSIRDRIAAIVISIAERRSGARPDLTSDDLRKIGLSSLDMVNLMLAVEAEFDLKIPESDMTPRNFGSLSAIETLISTLSHGGRIEDKAEAPPPFTSG